MNNKIAIQIKRDMVFLKWIDTSYLEVLNYNTLVYTRFEETHIANKTFDEYEALLIKHYFIRISDSCLINMDHIKTYRQSDVNPVVMRNDDVRSISREKSFIFKTMQ